MNWVRLGRPMYLATGEPSDPGRVKDLPLTNEEDGVGVGVEMVSLNAWEHVTLCQCYFLHLARTHFNLKQITLAHDWNAEQE